MSAARSLLHAYLSGQRDIGVEEFIFEHGSLVNSLINKAETKNAGANKVIRDNTGREKIAADRFNGAAPVSGRSNFESVSSSSRLSKIRPLDTFNYVKPIQSDKKNVPQRSEKREKLAVLYRETLNCDKCKLSQNRSKVIFGSGSADGKLLVIGESPSLCGADENTGLPFQGEAGELYDRILDRMGLDKSSDIFTAYLQKCRSNDENIFNEKCAAICKSLLDKQIEIIEPEALLIFGQSAANALLDNSDNIEQLRSANHTYKDRPVIVTYSLSLMNKEPNLRTGSWEDLKKILGIISSK